MINLGTDIQRNWELVDGDIQLVSDKNNLGQAILNRLLADKDFYNGFYLKYGSNLSEYYGEENNPTIREYIRVEVETTLVQDPRIQGARCEVVSYSNEQIGLKVTILTYENDELSYNLVISEQNTINLLENGV